jgi:protocatechuate 3,4-dioxygenase beta subunit
MLHSINTKHPTIRNSVTTMFKQLKRRRLLGFIGGAATVSVLGCSRKRAALADLTNSPTQTAAEPIAGTTPACVVRPQQTEGPYFVDEKLNRSDIRTDPSDGSTKPGVPLRLVFQVTQVSDNSCTPLENATVDIWHCDALGVYSDVADRHANTVGKKFLRGYQVTDARGRAEFTTIYPGWYPGRTVHIHFKIRTGSASQPSYEFTSQLYFDDAVSDRIYTQSPYSSKGERTQRNEQDGIFRDGGEQLMLQLTEDAQGYVATFDIGLQI